MVVRSGGVASARRLSGVVALSMAAVATVYRPAVSGKSHLGVFWAGVTNRLKRCSSAGILIRACGSGRLASAVRLGLCPGAWQKIEQNLLDIDADAATVITKFDMIFPSCRI
jgi:hypothetical protein